MDSSVIQRCLQLFTRYPFNNLLHHRVAGLVLTALERGSDEFLRYLFGPCQLIQWLTQAPDLVVPASRSADIKAGEPHHTSGPLSPLLPWHSGREGQSAHQA